MNSFLRKPTILFAAVFLSFLLLIPAASAARNNYPVNRLRHKTDTVSARVKAYVDSLRMYRDYLSTATKENDSLRAELSRQGGSITDYSRLFVPLTFYHDVAKGQFSLSPSTDQRERMVDDALLAAYLGRPHLVRESDGRLLKAGNIVHRPDAPVRSETELTAEVAESAPAPVAVEQFSPVNLVAEKPNFWAIKGDYSLQFLQNYISPNWYKGGESNYSMIAAVILQANYDNKQKIKWDNKLEMRVGFQTSPADTVHSFKTSEDLLRLTSKLGLQATKKWYYTLQMIAYTQFMRGYKSNDLTVYSDFLSPLNINLSLGMDYKVEWFNKHLTGTVNISPLAYNFRYVGRLALATRYSVDEGYHVLHDFGSTLTADLLWKFTDNISWQTRLYAYTTYKRAEVEWENTFTLQLNKYIATKVFLYPRFDDGVKRDSKHGYFQYKEYLSLGFNYSF